MPNNSIEQPESQSQPHVEAKAVQQTLENLPDEILNSKRFFPVSVEGDKKIPKVMGWQNPSNQVMYNEVIGLAGFDTTGHGIATDYLFFDFDHVLDDNKKFVNEDVEKYFNYIHSSFENCYCELSISGHGLHILAVPTSTKFEPVSNGKNGVLYFDRENDVKLEIFYKSKGRYCLLTGDLFRCSPKSPIIHGEIADDVLQTILDEIKKRQPADTKNKQTVSYVPTINVGDSTEYDLFRANIMLDAINPVSLSDNDWLVVMSVCKNIGVPYEVVDAFNHRDPKRYNEAENKTRWDSVSNGDIGMGALYNIAAMFGYNEKETRREWYKLHPELKTSGLKNMADDIKAELDNAIAFLDNLSTENFTADDAYDSNNIRFVALAQTYDFVALAEKFFVTIKEAKRLAKNLIAESKNGLTAPITKDEADNLNGLLDVSVKRVRKIVDSTAQELKQQKNAFIQRQKKIELQKRAKDATLEQERQNDKTLEEIGAALRLYNEAATLGREKKLQKLILDACDKVIDDDTGTIKYVRPTASNADLIFLFDPILSRLIGYDEFQQVDIFLKQAPWHKENCIGKEWTDKDDIEVRAYLRRTYTEFSDQSLISDWLTVYSNSNSFHAIKDYLKKLPAWDGTPRAETLFIKFLRVEDTPYAREVTMNWLTAAVARIFYPGCRYQTALVLHGAQGIGKSYVIERIGGKWYSAIIDNVDDSHAIDAIKTIWIGEFKEMAAMRKAELNAIKSFIERSEDNRRAPYARRSAKVLRHCVFVITVNDDQFLSDMTGNRRYMILHCNSARLNYVSGLTDEYIAQVWAEVYQKFNEKFADGFDESKLALSHSAQVYAEEIAQSHLRDDGMKGEIKAYVDTKIPPQVIWKLLTKEERRKFYANGFIKLLDGKKDLITRRRARGGRNVQSDIELIYEIFHDERFVRKIISPYGNEDEWYIYGSEYRKHICAAEIFNECFLGNDKRKSPIRIHEILNNLEGWTRGKRISHDPVYGNQQIVFYRDENNFPSEEDAGTQPYDDDEFKGNPVDPDDVPF